MCGDRRVRAQTAMVRLPASLGSAPKLGLKRGDGIPVVAVDVGGIHVNPCLRNGIANLFEDSSLMHSPPLATNTVLQNLILRMTKSSGVACPRTQNI